jgi:ribosomal protein L16 Arg81 hydroxylase
VLDVTLRAGDTMYLPRGWLHQALTTGSDSLHITVGVNVRRWIDEARAALTDSEGELALRDSIDAAPPPELPELDAEEVSSISGRRSTSNRFPTIERSTACSKGVRSTL